MKKNISLALAFIMVFAVLSTGTVQSSGVAEADETAPRYELTGVKCALGGTFDLYVSIKNNPGIISLRHTVVYDTYALELTGVENLGLLNGFTTPPAAIKSPYTLRWADALATENNTANGDTVKLSFIAKNTAAPGLYDISVVHVEARNAEGKKVAFADAAIRVELDAPLTGDADGDGEVTDWDAILFERYLANWSIKIRTDLMDIDGDGELSDWDAIMLNRYFANWNIRLPEQEVPTPTPEPTPYVEPTPTPRPRLNELIKENKEFEITGFTQVVYSPTYMDYRVGQGACSDGTYVYFILKPSADGEAIITKYNLKTGAFVKRSQPIYVFHGNDMTFDTARNLIYVSHGSSEGKILTTVDPDTLEVVTQSVSIKKGSGAITYSPERDAFAISQGGTSLHFLNNELKVQKSLSREALDYTAQGMGSDEDYIYFPMSPKNDNHDNVLVVYDWDGNYVTTIHMPTDWESESMFVVDGVYYVSFYHGDGARLFELEITVKE